MSSDVILNNFNKADTNIRITITHCRDYTKCGYNQHKKLTQQTSKAEIAKLDDAISRNQNIFRFNISMYTLQQSRT